MRIAIVNDSATARLVMSRVVSEMKGCQVAWMAADGTEAANAALRDRPDLILMDLLMPNQDGVSATRLIMSKSPCPILIVTASPDKNFSLVFQALGAGALDVVQTPEIDGTNSGWIALEKKIRSLNLAPGRVGKKEASEPRNVGTGSKGEEPLVVIGSSAGGPAALAKVLSGFPKDFGASIIIAQHLSSGFIDGLASWLASQCSLPVRVARGGEAVVPGTVFLADPSGHLEIGLFAKFRYIPVSADDFVSPMVDRLFSSVASSWKAEAVIGVLLTGMGADGAAGLLEMRQRGCFTLVESEETCLVFGMPGAAVRLGAACEVLPIGKIAGRIREVLRK